MPGTLGCMVLVAWTVASLYFVRKFLVYLDSLSGAKQPTSTPTPAAVPLPASEPKPKSLPTPTPAAIPVPAPEPKPKCLPIEEPPKVLAIEDTPRKPLAVVVPARSDSVSPTGSFESAESSGAQMGVPVNIKFLENYRTLLEKYEKVLDDRDLLRNAQQQKSIVTLTSAQQTASSATTATTSMQTEHVRVISRTPHPSPGKRPARCLDSVELVDPRPICTLPFMSFAKSQDFQSSWFRAFDRSSEETLLTFSPSELILLWKDDCENYQDLVAALLEECTDYRHMNETRNSDMFRLQNTRQENHETVKAMLEKLNREFKLSDKKLDAAQQTLRLIEEANEKFETRRRELEAVALELAENAPPENDIAEARPQNADLDASFEIVNPEPGNSTNQNR